MGDRRRSPGLGDQEVKRSRSTEDVIRGIDVNRNIEALWVKFLSTSRRTSLIQIFSHNRIENPLIHLTPEQLLRDVRYFAQIAHLDHERALLERAAQLAKDPQQFAASKALTADEELALKHERTRRFRSQPPALYLTIIVCSIGAAV
ncbi:MAG: hypothetical protein Q9174_006692, partial [Haloplaca sp. 1 TL-2023]